MELSCFNSFATISCTDGILQALWRSVWGRIGTGEPSGTQLSKRKVDWFAMSGSRAAQLAPFIHNTMFICSQSAVHRLDSSTGCEMLPSQTVPRGTRRVSCFCPQLPLLSHRAGHRLAITETAVNLPLKWEVESHHLWNLHFSSLWKCIPVPGYPIVYPQFWHGRAGRGDASHKAICKRQTNTVGETG